MLKMVIKIQKYADCFLKWLYNLTSLFDK